MFVANCRLLARRLLSCLVGAGLLLTLSGCRTDLPWHGLMGPASDAQKIRSIWMLGLLLVVALSLASEIVKAITAKAKEKRSEARGVAVFAAGLAIVGYVSGAVDWLALRANAFEQELTHSNPIAQEETVPLGGLTLKVAGEEKQEWIADTAKAPDLHKAEGVWLVVRLHMRNDGDSAQTFEAARQNLSLNGGEYAPYPFAAVSLNPGVVDDDVMLAFDVPTDTNASGAVLKLHQSGGPTWDGPPTALVRLTTLSTVTVSREPSGKLTDQNAYRKGRTAAAATGPTIGDECHDWMKFVTDPLSGQEMVCGGYPADLDHGEPMRWFSAEEGAVGPAAGMADKPSVGMTGSSCSGEVQGTMGRSSDGYLVWCRGGPDSYMPGTQPVWTVYHP